MSQPKARRRSLRGPLGIATVAFAAATVAALAASAGCSVENAVVGGACATGLTQCGFVCVDIEDDPMNCGGCGNVCPASPGVCMDGECVKDEDSIPPRSSGDGGSARGGSDAGRTQDGPKGDAHVGGDSAVHATGPDAGPHDGSSSDAPASDGYVPDATKSDGPPVDGPGPSDVVVGDVVEEGCTAPEKYCGGVCVDESDDPDNCGSCGNVCGSGICYMGVCEGSTDGDIVIIGHDYHSSSSTLSEAKVVSNAVFLPSTNPVRILSFEHYANATSISNVKSLLGTEATLLGRTLDYTVSVTDADIPSDLTITAYDVLLVYDQEAAAPGVLGPMGSSWASTLSAFTIAGGVVVALDGAAGTTQEMPQFDTNAGLLAVSAHTVISKGTPLSVVAPGDVIGHGVLSPYAAEFDSVYFTTSVPNGGNVTYVVVDPLDAGEAPVVVHVDVP
jgi:stigma-specific protein Stig1